MALPSQAAPGLQTASAPDTHPALHAAAPGAAPEAAPPSGCPQVPGCARAEWACGARQQWRLTRSQHRTAAAAEVCSADLDASFCFLGRCAYLQPPHLLLLSFSDSLVERQVDADKPCAFVCLSNHILSMNAAWVRVCDAPALTRAEAKQLCLRLLDRHESSTHGHQQLHLNSRPGSAGPPWSSRCGRQ